MVFDHCRCLDFDKEPILPSVVFCAERGSSVNMSPLYMVSVTHATGEAFIGQENCSVMTASGLGFREVYFITWY